MLFGVLVRLALQFPQAEFLALLRGDLLFGTCDDLGCSRKRLVVVVFSDGLLDGVSKRCRRRPRRQVLEVRRDEIEPLAAIDALVAEGDKVAAYMRFEGKGYRTDIFGDVPPRGQNVRISLMMLLTFKDGKIVEKRAHFDVGDIRRQLAAG